MRGQLHLMSNNFDECDLKDKVTSQLVMIVTGVDFINRSLCVRFITIEHIQTLGDQSTLCKMMLLKCFSTQPCYPKAMRLQHILISRVYDCDMDPVKTMFGCNVCLDMPETGRARSERCIADKFVREQNAIFLANRSRSDLCWRSGRSGLRNNDLRYIRVLKTGFSQSACRITT